jgi:hypothetical protein
VSMYRFFAGLLIAGVVGGCTTMVASSSREAGVSPSVLQTYAWAPEPQKPTGDPSIDYSVVDARIRRAIETELMTRGYKKASNNKPDFLVACYAAMQRSLDAATTNPSYRDDSEGQPQGVAKKSVAREYRQASLRLDIMEPQGQRLIWQGSAQALISLASTTQEREERIQEAVHQLLEGFPP